MKSSKFLLILRGIIREEIQLALKPLIKEIRVVKESSIIKRHNPQRITDLKSLTNGVRTKKVQTKLLSKNPTLNNILQETAQVMTETDFNADDTDMLQEEVVEQAPTEMRFTTKQIASVSEMLPKTDVEGVPLMIKNTKDPQVQKNLEGVANALTRDYRKLIKVIDHKKK